MDVTLTQFSEMGLAAPIARAVEEAGYETPTPIQSKTIPALLDGHDVVGIAQTGTGKTAAFVLPLLHRLAESPEPAGPRGCRALILAPTRELAAQIEENASAYSRHLKLKRTVIVGGVKPRPQIKALEPGVDLLIATPGRLLDHVGTGALKLDKVKTVVLDEADQMMDLGFMPAIRRIMGKLRKNRQTVLFSATMPKQIRQLADDFLNEPIEVSVAPQSTPVEVIDQQVRLLERKDKRDALRDILSDRSVERAIVFTRTKYGANRVAENLGKDGLEARAIHGNKSQNQREKALAAFKDGSVKILVATDIAARGIDVPGVSHVVNHDLPNVPEAYVHRIGRTARAGANGVAISLVEMEDRPLLRDIEKLIGRFLSEEGEALEIPKGIKRPGGGNRGGRGGGSGGGGGRGRGKSQGGQSVGQKRRSTGKPKAQGAAKPQGEAKAKNNRRRRPRRKSAAPAA